MKLSVMHSNSALLLLSSCWLASAQQNFDVVTNTPSRVPISASAQFQCTFQNRWSAARHPRFYPGDAHWSPPIITSHNNVYTLWEEGGFATPGVELVAEEGGTFILESELSNAGNNVRDWIRGMVTFNRVQQSQNLGILQVDQARPFLSSISMIAESPDWFSGFTNFQAHDGSSWFRTIEIETYPFDAGTEDGIFYSLNNFASNPQQTITRFTTATVPSSEVFLNPARTTVLPVARWICNLQNADPPLPVTFPSPDIPAARPFNVLASMPSRVPIAVPASYNCDFINRWSAVRHPRLYPGSAHWSPPVMVSHGSDYTLWSPDDGSFATPGIERVAETGATFTLVGELQAAVTRVFDWTIGVVTFNRSRQMQNLGSLQIDQARPFLSSISMIAESPDWFSGFTDFQAHDGTNWYRTIDIETFPFDAGTESGDMYSLSNPPSNPIQPIFQLTASTVPSTGVFLTPAGDDVLPVARWTCTLETQDPPIAPIATDGPFCFSGETTVSVQDKGMIPMSELKVGDHVLTSSSKYERVYSFAHRDETRKATFLQFMPSQLEVTGNHLVHVRDLGMIPASKVQVGHSLVGVDNNKDIVVEAIRKVIRNGIYTPFTPSGTIIVNGVEASNYVSIPQQDQLSGFLSIGGFKTPFSFHWLEHSFQVVHRFWCHWLQQDDIMMEQSGLSAWSHMSLQFVEWLFSQNAIVMAFIMAPLLISLMGLSLVESVMMMTTTAFAVTAAVLGVTWAIRGRGQKSATA